MITTPNHPLFEWEWQSNVHVCSLQRLWGQCLKIEYTSPACGLGMWLSRADDIRARVRISTADLISPIVVRECPRGRKWLLLSHMIAVNSFIPVSYLALLLLIPMYITVLSFLGFHKEKMYERGYVGLSHLCLQALSKLVKPWQPIYRCVGKWSQKAMVTLSESLSPGANKGDTYLF